MNAKLRASLSTSLIASAALLFAPLAGIYSAQAFSPAQTESQSREPTPTPWNQDETMPGAGDREAFKSEETGGQVDVPAFLNDVATDADQVWTDYFARTGLTEPFVTVHYVGTAQEPTYTFSEECGGDTRDGNYPNAFYCPTGDGDLVLPVNTFAKVWDGDFFERSTQQTGDFAAAFVVAHEFGHHIQDEIVKQNNGLVPDILNKDENKELIADCFAGNWAYTAYYKGYIEPGDYNEVIQSVRAIGDPPGASDHGDPDERQGAFELGYNTGDPTRCIVSYWPAGATALSIQ